MESFLTILFWVGLSSFLIPFLIGVIDGFCQAWLQVQEEVKAQKRSKDDEKSEKGEDSDDPFLL